VEIDSSVLESGKDGTPTRISDLSEFQKTATQFVEEFDEIIFWNYQL
jgi:hypothetical protein